MIVPTTMYRTWFKLSYVLSMPIAPLHMHQGLQSLNAHMWTLNLKRFDIAHWQIPPPSIGIEIIHYLLKARL